MDTNKKASDKAYNTIDFECTNASGKWHDDRYMVKSYSEPIYVFDRAVNMWFGVNHKFSQTTTRHMTTFRPPRVDHWVSREQIRQIAVGGYAHYISKRME